MENNPVSYMQNDKRWGSKNYSAKGEKTTIGRAGCGPTCAAMVVATLADMNETPDKAAKWSLRKGYKACKQGTYYSFFTPYFKRFNIKCTKITTSSVYHKLSDIAHKKAFQALLDGDMVIACMGRGIWTSSGHFVLAYKTDGRRVYINDPASKKPMRLCNSIEAWQYEVKHYFIVEVPKKSKKGDNELVEKRDVIFDDKEYIVNAINKDGENFIKIKDLEKFGFKISSLGAKPVISMDMLEVNLPNGEIEIKGINSNGTTYGEIRKVSEKLGHKVGWNKKIIIR